MSDYHSIALNLVILVNYMQMKAQKVCEYQDTNFNKNALVFFSSDYINWILIATSAQHICENCISTFFHSNRLCHLLCILTSSIWNFRANSFSDVTSSTMWLLELFQRCRFWLFQRCIVWSFRANSFNMIWRRFWKVKLYIDAKIAETNESRFDVLQIWRKVEL